MEQHGDIVPVPVDSTRWAKISTMTSSGPATLPEARLLVDGRLVGAADGLRWTAVDPTTEEPIGPVPDAGPADLDLALASARTAVDRSAWASDPDLRRRCLERLHSALVAHGPAVRALTTRVTGLPVALLGLEHDAPLADLGAAAAADLPTADRPGVVAVLTPFTSPHRAALDRVAAALLAGHAAVLKPAPVTAPLACELGRLAVEAAGFPPGVLSVLPSRDVDLAIALTTDPRVDAVDLAGSAVVAERVRHQAAGKSVQLEVGGPGRVVVGDDDDLDAVVRRTVHEVALHAGQRVGAPSLLVVPARRYDEAVELAAAVVQALRPGDPRDPTTVCGPLVSAVQRDRVRRYLALAEHEGGRVVCGGGPVPGRDRGYWLDPAVVAGVGPEARVAREEILGPVLVVVPG